MRERVTIENLSFVHLGIVLVMLALFALAIWALVTTLRSSDTPTIEKVAWTAILIFFPVLGVLVWLGLYFIPRRRSAPRS